MLDCHRLGNGMLSPTGKWRGALSTIKGIVGVLKLTFRALDGHGCTLLSGVAKGYQGMEERVKKR
jgi:hypothetical protein